MLLHATEHCKLAVSCSQKFADHDVLPLGLTHANSAVRKPLASLLLVDVLADIFILPSGHLAFCNSVLACTGRCMLLRVSAEVRAESITVVLHLTSSCTSPVYSRQPAVTDCSGGKISLNYSQWSRRRSSWDLYSDSIFKNIYILPCPCRVSRFKH